MSDQGIAKEYTNGKINVVWKPTQCIHSGICLSGLPEVFDLKQRPWVDMTAATSEKIVDQVRACPSKALTIKGVRFKESSHAPVEVTVIPHGPIIIKGEGTVAYRKNKEVFHETVSFCRCGRSKKFPYCDGTHAKPKDK